MRTLLLILLFLTLLDTHSTYLCVTGTNGHVEEANPILAGWMKEKGVAGALWQKFFLQTGGIAAMLVLSIFLRHPIFEKTVTLATLICIVFYFFIVINNYQLYLTNVGRVVELAYT